METLTRRYYGPDWMARHGDTVERVLEHVRVALGCGCRRNHEEPEECAEPQHEDGGVEPEPGPLHAYGGSADHGQHRGEVMGLPRETWDAHDSGDDSSWPATGDAVNAALAAAAQVQPLAEVLAQSASTHAELLALLGSMTQEDLDRPYSHYQPDNPPLNPAPVAGWIHGKTWEQYHEHIGWLEAGLRGWL